MAVLQTGQSFSSGDQVTATKLEDIANLATFRTGTNQTADDSTIQVDGSGGYLKVKSAGISSNELATDSVITAKIQDDAVTSDKLAHISNLNVLGNVSGSTAAPVGVEIKNEDDMVSDSATALATQQSIKAYVQSATSSITQTYDSGWVNTVGAISLANNAQLTFNHNLGENAVMFRVFVASNSNGANAFQADGIQLDSNTNAVYGCQVTSTTTNSATVWCSNYGVLEWKGRAWPGDPSSNGASIETFGTGGASYIRFIASI